jgi:TolB-like protein/class 3 adenylate cyclase/Tfp pilus assembly protein PilF
LTGKRVLRRLAAILAVDVVGYSRLMGDDEDGTHARFKSHRSERLEPSVARHGGRVVKQTGDGALMEFPSAVDALAAAIEFQQAVSEANQGQPQDTAMVFRMGLHLGDLIIETDDVYGDSVNIAARLEGESPAGGIVISGNVHDAVAGRLKATFEDLGTLSLKNIGRPIQAFAVKWEPEDWQAAAITAAPSYAEAPLALPDKPSIAVLPFQNMSDDPEQEYFADGMVEDIITGLSHSKQLFVIARNSSFAYKGKSPDIRQVGRELGVRYVLEGSVRKAGNRVRITGQLIEATNGAHLWAERFDGSLDDIFELQDQVAARTIGAIAPALDQAEIERSRRKPLGDLAAYDHHLRGMASLYRFSKEANEEALGHFLKAHALDPDFALPLSFAANCYIQRRAFGWGTDPKRELAEAERLARRSLALERGDPRVLANAAWVLANMAEHLKEGSALLDHALELDPNFALGLIWKAAANLWSGEPSTAIENFKRALRLSPLDPRIFLAQSGMAAAHFLADRYADAILWAEKALREHPMHLHALRTIIAAHALAGTVDESQRLWKTYQPLDPNSRIGNIREWLSYRREEDIGKYARGLRLAGMPD